MNIVSDKAFYIDVGHKYLYRMSLSDDTVEVVMKIKLKMKTMRYLDVAIVY